MTLLLEEFVNREEQLVALWKIVRQEVNQRALLIYGPDGMGKTFLLDEFHAECEEEGINCARIDFAEGSNQDYVNIVLEVRNQLGPKAFEHLAQVIKETSSYGARESLPTSSVPASAGRLAADVVPPAERSGGVDFHGSATIYGDVIGGHVFYLTQTIRGDDPMVQNVIQADITAAFQECLVDFAARHKVVFLIDSWEQATTDTQNWLCHNLLRWIIDKKLSQAVAVVAGCDVPNLGRSCLRVGRLTLAELPAESVRTYWVEKRGLPSEDVPYIIKFSNREPLLLALMADRQLVS